ncbi:MAG: hypothetical protein OXH00_02645 [Candidatus Poribacteria bacterium]|nr:hypothetical protein [Candidatus Poribacteria bacterium]
MATRGEIRQGVRYHLGERTPGTWQDDEINYFIQESGNEHAKRAYSVKTIIYTSTLQNVRDYAFPPNFGDLLSVRYRDETISDEWGLIYVDKDVLRDWSYTGTENGDPYYYYREQDSFGLFPVPNKLLVVEYKFENDCPGFTEIFDRESMTGFSQDLTLEVVADTTEPTEMEVRDTDLDPRCVWGGVVSLYLRRSGTYFPGKLWLSFTNLTGEHQFVHTSGELSADSINSRPEWVHFDFTQNPIEINSTEQTYRMRLHVDNDYQAAEPRSYGGSGILVGTQVVEGTPQAFFQIHRLRHDLEVEYYRNTCDVMTDDEDVINIPDRYTETIVHMTLEKCYLKDGYDPRLAAYWQAKAEMEIKEAKAQAVIPTLGKRRELRRSAPRLTNLTYNNRTGLFRLRLGRP